MPTLRALFVAINTYPNPAHRLNGCLNDMEQVKKHLEACCTALGMGFDARVLTNEQATRAEVITGFEHFEEAGPDDPCLFFYAGHGARSNAPKPFWHMEPDHKNDSIVCYDSRIPNGRDLMDKELSYLIWKANHNNNLPFISITDCCHSGSFRELGEAPLGDVRQIREIGENLLEEQYLGIEHYKRSGNGELSPPQGRRIHLAAARDVETAKELRIGTEYRGIFSYFLEKTLSHTGPAVTYAELMSRVQMRVRGNIADQSPQLWATQEADKRLRFLLGDPAPIEKTYMVGFDKNRGWLLNAGAAHGLPIGQAETIKLEIPELQRTVTLGDIQPTFSVVLGMDDLEVKRTYQAIVSQRPIPKFKITFAADNDHSCMAVFTLARSGKTADFWTWTEDDKQTDFLVYARNEAFWLSRTCDPKPLFRPVTTCDQTAALAFLHEINIITSWQHHLEMDNPNSEIGTDEFDLQLYRVTDPGNMENDAPVEALDWLNAPLEFLYTDLNGQAQQPVFQLKIHNVGQRPLWFSLLYFASDYSVSNALMPKQLLNQGEEAWATDVFEGNTYRSIPLQINEDNLEKDKKGTNEYIKLYVCTEELDTDILCQNGLKTNNSNTFRQLGFSEKNALRDWKCIGIWLRISAYNYSSTEH